MSNVEIQPRYINGTDKKVIIQDVVLITPEQYEEYITFKKQKLPQRIDKAIELLTKYKNLYGTDKRLDEIEETLKGDSNG